MDFKKDIYQDPDIKKYVKIIARDPRTFASLANALLNKGYVDEAISVCEEGLEADPDFIAGRAVLGKCYVKDGKIDKAQEEFEAILEQNHDNVVALIGLGEIYYSMEEYSGALEMYERLLFIDPMNEEFQEMVEKIKGLQSGAIPAPSRAETPVETPEGEGEEAPEPFQAEEPYPEEAAPSFDREPAAEEPPPVSPGETLVTADSVDALLNLIGETVVRARHVLERGFDESNQLLFNRLASGTNRSVWEDVNRRLDSYLSQEADEGEIVPIERGVSPHKSEEIEIDGTENIGIASKQEVKIDQNIVSYDSIVSNDQIAYESVAKNHEEDEEAGVLPEEEIPETTLKGADALDMDLEENEGEGEESLIPENVLEEPLTEEPASSAEEEGLSVPPSEPEDDLQEEILDAEEEILDEEEGLLDEGLDEISEEPPAGLPEEEIEPGLSSEATGTDAAPAFDSEETLSPEEGDGDFREDSYPSLEEDVSHPQDLNALMAEAEKSLSGAGIETDEGLEDDIMDELEAETRSLQDAKNREAFSGESLVHLDEESSLAEGDNDKFSGHQEIDVGSMEPSGEREESKFQGHDELEMTETAIPRPSAPQPSAQQMEPPSDLDLKEEPLTASIPETGEISIDETRKDNDNADELVDADDETLDDIGKWLNDL
ncbi:MAG TPA: tetratricopeptide repeat protein [Candidatus Mcinerneyibacteriales bacterium]|nr:tetratricopeptide repeat protein [Candidatus Mcinerneyibacteriales bacterium]